MDIKLDEDFDVVIDGTNDLAMVSGAAEFEQEFRQGLAVYFREILGNTNQTNTRRKIRKRASDIAQDSPFVNSLESIQITETEPGVLDVYIHYNIDQEFEMRLI